MARTERGFALVEALPVLSVLAMLVAGLMITTYLLFARAWVSWQSEQALYCAAVRPRAERCERDLVAKVREFLPWGRARAHVGGLGPRWEVEVWWQWNSIRIHERRELTPRAIVSNRDLPW